MRTIVAVVHDIWCAVSKRCRIRPPDDDPDLRWLRSQELAARKSASAIHHRRIRDNPVEAMYLRGRHHD